MKFAKIFHNPKAGGSVKKRQLVQLIKDAGYQCSYSSTKHKDWNDIDAVRTDLLVVAGGDGTVRKVATNMLDLRIPIALLPMGTANNIANTLGINGTPESIVEGWSAHNFKNFDVGKIYGVKKHNFFLEGMGFGLFPKLMKKMVKVEERLSGAPEESLKVALKILHDIILTSKARYCKVSIDGTDHSGKFLLVEVMNTQSIGPNLNLASFADPGDGMFEVILIAERQRDEFAAYVHNKLYGIEQPPIFNVLKAKNLDIFWEGTNMHIDDEIVELKKPQDIRVKLQEGLLRFAVPAEKPSERLVTEIQNLEVPA